jgi:hypothetical protein
MNNSISIGNLSINLKNLNMSLNLIIKLCNNTTQKCIPYMQDNIILYLNLNQNYQHL